MSDKLVPYALPSVAYLYEYHIMGIFRTKKGNKKERLFSVTSSSKDLAIEYFYVQVAQHNEEVPQNPWLDMEVQSCTERKRILIGIDTNKLLSYRSL